MDSQQNLLDSRADIEFLPIPTEESDEETRNNDDVPSFTMDMDDTENDQERTGSLTPLQPDVDKVRRSDNFKVGKIKIKHLPVCWEKNQKMREIII